MHVRCRLAAGVRLASANGRCLVIADRPLTVVEVREQGLRLLERCREGAELTPTAAEERLLRRLAELGLLDLRPAMGPPPTVRVIVPVRGRQAALDRCLRSLAALRYPAGRLELVAVDDASERPVRVPDGVRLLRLPAPQGPGGARNAGAASAGADVLAFLDSDCQADPGWLEELTRELADPDVGAAGGRVRAASERTWLERYEAVRSPLDLGPRPGAARPGGRVPYLVGANLAVRRSAFEAVGGFGRGFRFGEDVDLSWRLVGAGFRLAYQPRAVVRHAHRAALPELAATRARYAGSEAMLLGRHPAGRGAVALSPGAAAALVAPLGLAALAAETALAVGRLRRHAGVEAGPALRALTRGQASALYHVARLISRYYALPVAAAVGLAGGRRRLLALAALALLGPAAADWWRLRPRLTLPAFAAAHVVDELAYHAGVLLGCVRHRTLRPLGLRIVIRRASR